MLDRIAFASGSRQACTVTGGWLYIDGHLDLRPVERWPHSITDDDLKAVIAAFLTATARVSPNLNPHAHCHNAMVPFSVKGERMNVAGSLFCGLSMRCTSTPPCLLARQKKARSSVPHRGILQSTHCIRHPVACGLAVDDAGIGSCASCGDCMPPPSTPRSVALPALWHSTLCCTPRSAARG